MTLRARFDRAHVPPPVVQLCEKLTGAGFRAWVVGGCVRDHLMGREVNDWDVCTSATPREVMNVFPRVVPTGIQHGTVTVLLGATGYEVTTLRGEGAYSDGRRPDQVTFVRSVHDDLARRDFTVNAIAYDPLRDELVDAFDGLGDLARGIVRAVGDPMERFGEDGLRVLRAARFVATLDFELDPATEAAIEPNVTTFQRVSAERVRDEWLKTMKARRPSRAFDVMRRTGILGVVMPALVALVGCPLRDGRAEDAWTHSMRVLDATAPGDIVVRLAALLHDVGKGQGRDGDAQPAHDAQHAVVGAERVDAFARAYRFSNQERERVTHLVRHHVIDYASTWSEADVRRFVRRVGRESLEPLFALRSADLTARDESTGALDELRTRVARVLDAREPLTSRDLAVNGNDLMTELGIPRSRRVGEILEVLLERVIDDPRLNQRDLLLDVARGL